MKTPKRKNLTTYAIACILSNKLEIPFIEISTVLNETTCLITDSLKQERTVELTNFITLKPEISKYGNKTCKAYLSKRYRKQFRDNKEVSK